MTAPHLLLISNRMTALTQALAESAPPFLFFIAESP